MSQKEIVHISIQITKDELQTIREELEFLRYSDRLWSDELCAVKDIRKIIFDNINLWK